MAKLRNGFRKEAEELAEEMRFELGLQNWMKLCPFTLASHLEIPVMGVSSIDQGREEFEHLISPAGTRFFGCVLPLEGGGKWILHNDLVARTRQVADVAHEISHILLGHPLAPPSLGDGSRSYDAVREHEARELGMTLLVSKWAALRIAENQMTDVQASEQYGVSPALIQHRLRITNANNWAYNRRSKARYK